VWNVYGPTETTIWSTTARITSEPIAIGRPIDNTQLYVLDDTMQPVFAGVPGELFIAGAGLGRGYLGRADLTAERFAPDRFASAGARMYRTGDLVRVRADGNVEFLGRLDHQVKIRGFRIEIGEVESVVASAPGVRAAAATVREDTPGAKRLVAYVVPREGASVSVETLRAHAARALPEYMVPQVCVVLEALPLTPNGKVDRRALPAPGAHAPGAAYVAPRGDVEVALAAICAELLDVQRVGAEDDFFTDLGGDSIKAFRLVARATASSIPLRVVDVFECHTVAALAKRANPTRDIANT
jgi:acyl-coenzyme A synthetase/AMP-(fatty) acid ligase